MCSLPVAPVLTDDEREALSRELVQAKPYDGRCLCRQRTCTTKAGQPKPVRLLRAQADGIAAFRRVGGGFFSIKVGGGKTGLSILMANDHFLRAGGQSKILLLLPANVYQQFWIRDRSWAYSHLAIGLPFFGLGSTSQKSRLTAARSRRPGCYVLPYSCLSTEDTIEVLQEINADLAICDEGDELKDGTGSAKAKRWWAYVDRRNPTPRGVVMSGSLTTRTPMDYHRLLRWSLGDKSPLPRPVVEAVRWSSVLRSRKPHEDPPLESELRDLEPLRAWAQARGVESPSTVSGTRAAYRHRLQTVPGFVTSGEDSLGIPIVMSNSPAGEPNDRLKALLKDVEDKARGPNGDVLKFGVEQHMAMRELTAGFYNKRYWDETHPLVEQAKACFAAEQEYAKELNQFFKSTKIPRPGLDTPMVVGKYHADKGPVRGWDGLYQLWKAWKDLQREDLPERQSEPIRVCDYKIKHAVEWAKTGKKKGGILWCYHRGVMEWLVESLRAAGVRTLLKGGGDSWLNDDGSEEYFCVASIEAHYRGKNLQHHTNQLLVQWPRGSDYCEQLLGRCHRTGQTADRLIVHTNHTLDFDLEQQAATIADTIYDHETLGGERKLLIADWSPPPRNISDEMLIKKGYAHED